MNLERYPYFYSNNNRGYQFYSDGPKGRITKMVTFTRMADTDPPIYNLAFGDLTAGTSELDDRAISNNADRDLILATVANVVANFCDRYDNCYVYAEGSTSARTRLYQIGIAGLWQEISADFRVYALTNNGWENFKPYSINYEAFLVTRK